MRVQKIPPEAKAVALFPDAEFADAYRLVVNKPVLDAFTTAGDILGRSPLWIKKLLSLRNQIVVPLGLKPALLDISEESAPVGAFPVISREPERVILGFDDKHLDFRIVVETCAIEARASEVTVTTLVCPHNLLGRAYLAFVLPFHRTIVPAMLAQAARP